jgi:O-antigen/teichoic acid export membrane protein
MSVALLEEASSPPDEPTTTTASAASDTLGASLLLMVGMLGVQRAVGLVREVLFCRWLEPAALGEWELALSFLTMAAPLVVLGIPGSFGRYVEHYRHRGQLSAFVRRTALATALLCGAGAGALVWLGDAAAPWIFGQADRMALVVLVAAALLALVASNFANDLLAGLRRFRAVAALQFVQGISFTVLGLALAVCWAPSTAAVLAAFLGSCALTAATGVWAVRGQGVSAGGAAPPLGAAELWRKLAPFAAWVWLTNVLLNAFLNVDRYLLVHQVALPADEALSLVGNYRASRVVPLLLATVAATVASVLLPHLSHDWEAGRRRQVAARMNLVLKLLGLAGLAVGVVVLLAAPLLFDVAWEGKYAAGQAVLPWTMAYCLWIGLGLIAHNYLWCAERAGWGTLAVLIGLAANVTLNGLLAPRYGLTGVVVGTAAANLLVLLLTYAFAWRWGLRPDAGTWLVTALPLSLIAGPLVAAGLLALIGAAAAFGNTVLHAEEKQQVRAGLAAVLARARRLLPGSALDRTSA